MKTKILLSVETSDVKGAVKSAIAGISADLIYRDISDQVFNNIDEIQPTLTIIEVNNNEFIQNINSELINSEPIHFEPLILLIHKQLTIPFSIINENDKGNLTIIRVPDYFEELNNRINIYINIKKHQQTHNTISPTRNSIRDIFETFLKNLNEMVYIADATSCRIIYANKRFKEVFTKNPENKLCWDVLGTKNSGPCKKYASSSTYKEISTYNRVVYYEAISKWYSIDEFLTPWFNKKIVRVHIGTDITSIKKIQSQLRESKIKAEKATHLKDQFISLVAHDLKSPFVSVMADLELLELQREVISEEAFHDIHSRVLSNGTRAIKLINILLNLNRLKTGSIQLDYKIIDGSKITDSIINELKVIAEKKTITLDNQIPDDIWLFADASLFGEVIYNVINNAIKFSQINSKIKIYCPDKNLSEIIIKDQGIGMPEKVLEDLFVSDYTTSQIGTAGERGTGLGLNYCKDIMKAHNGDILIKTKENKGTSVTLKLPKITAKIIVISDEILDKNLKNDLSAFNFECIEINSKNMDKIHDYKDYYSICAIIYNLDSYNRDLLQKLAGFKKPVFLIQKENKHCDIKTKNYPKLICIDLPTLIPALKNIVLWSA